MSDHTIERLRLGEIFSYNITYIDEASNKEETAERQAFFIQVEDLFYLIYINEDSQYDHMTEVAGMKYNGEQRKGSDPFTHIEALKFLKSRKVTASGKFIVESKKKEIRLKKSVLSVAKKYDEQIRGAVKQHVGEYSKKFYTFNPKSDFSNSYYTYSKNQTDEI